MIKKYSFFILVVSSIIYSESVFSQASKVAYTALYDDVTFNRSINTGKAVGVIPGEASVSPMGGASYTMPITLPPGISTMAPKISVEYNSLSGNGLLGYGWNIGGLSSITRVQKDQYHDEIVAPVNCSISDNFSLDGQRLISKNGTLEFNAEVENYSKITAEGTFSGSGGGPSWFKVITKTGITMEFGNTADSRVLENAGAVVLIWKLNKIYDNFGNYIEFKYKNYTVGTSPVYYQNLIDEINYTGNTAKGVSPFNKLKFSYVQRADKNNPFVSGTILPEAHLLEKIVVTGENTQAFKTFNFSYGYDGLYSYLNAVNEVEADATMPNNTIFKYFNGGCSEDNSILKLINGADTLYFVNNDKVDMISGDFNGDGYSDLLISNYRLVNGVKWNDDYAIYIKIPNSSFFKIAAHGFLQGNVTLRFLDKYPNYTVNDFDGDGNADFMTYSSDIDINANGIPVVGYYGAHIYFVTNNGNTVNPVFQPLANSTDVGINPLGHSFYSADFDGDGRLDNLTILMDENTFHYKAYLSTPSLQRYNKPITFYVPGHSSDAEDFLVNSDKIFVLDFDGDGKSELMCVKDANTNIIGFRPLSFNDNIFSFDAEVLATQGYPTKWHDVYLGDFNGDRKTDILTRTQTTNTWEIGYSNGKYFGGGTFLFNTPPPANYNLKTGDYNGDGKTDIILLDMTPPFGGMQSLYSSNGLGFNYVPFLAFIPTQDPTTFLNADYNGDGKEDLMYYISSSGMTNLWHARINIECKDRLLQKVSNGFNHVSEFDYNKLTAGEPFYKKGRASAFPLTSIQPGLYLVSKLKTPDGIGGQQNIDYSYYGAYLHRGGKGFLGFESTTVTNQAAGTISTTAYEFSSVFYTAAVARVTNKLLDGTLLSTIANSNSFVPLGNKRFAIQVLTSTETNNLTGAIKATSNTYDAYGNITAYSINNNGVEITNGTTVFGAFGTIYPAKPTSITISNTRNGSPTVTRKTTLSYNTLGALINRVDNSGTSLALTTAYTYDGFGNVLTQTQSGSGLTSRVNSYTYEAKGRFPLTHKNPLAQVENFTYNALWGTIATSKGIDGLTTSYTYDVFGRLTKVVTPQNYAITTSYGWDIQSGTSPSIFYTLTSHPGRPDVKVWSDILGRETKKQTEGFSGQWTTELSGYDNKGNLLLKTKPAYANESVFQTNYTYDNMNRIATINDPTNMNLQYSYTNNTSTGTTTTSLLNSLGQTTSKTVDATGKVVSTTDAGGTLSFKYDGFGNQTEVRLGSSVIEQSESDVCGRQSKLIDRNAGTTMYVYNAFGELISQTTANNQISTSSYDVLGRMTTKTTPEGTVSYTYYPTGTSGVNNIKKVTNFNGNTQEYVYDANSRLTQFTENIGGTVLATQYIYNTYNPIAINYNSGFGVTQSFDANGFLTEVKSGTTSIYKVNSMNGYGKCTSYTMGNGKTSIINYDNGIPNRFQTPGIQDLAINRNPINGNVLSRVDYIKNQAEVFSYDNLDRLLTVAKLFQTPSITCTYSNDGNLLSKTEAGNYTYTANRPNAVRRVTNPNNVIPNLEQSILYSSSGLANKITENGWEATYDYGADLQRKKLVLKTTGSTTPFLTRYYSGAYETQTINFFGTRTQQIHYISGPAGIACIAVRENGTNALHYTYTDHLGSILTCTDATGGVEVEQSFDAWGRKRNPTDWTYSNMPDAQFWLYRGYTAHEHLDGFNLINMNARLYDPLLGRMLSPDNVVQAPYYTQSYNRYSYVVNNPLKYSDPTGNEFGVGSIGYTYVPPVIQIPQFSYSAGYASYSSSSLGYSASFSGYSYNSTLNQSTTAFGYISSYGNSTYASGFINTMGALGGSFSVSGSYYSISSLPTYDYARILNNVGLSNEALEGIAVGGWWNGAAEVIIGGVLLYSVVDNADATESFLLETSAIAARKIESLSDPNNSSTFKYITYTKTNPFTGQVYVGRSSGYGTPEQIARIRDYGHEKWNDENFGPAQVTTWLPATQPGGYKLRYGDPSYWAIRGSEQIQIISFRAEGMSANPINGIGLTNQYLLRYLKTALDLLDF